MGSCTQVSENGWCDHNQIFNVCPVSCGVECLSNKPSAGPTPNPRPTPGAPLTPITTCVDREGEFTVRAENTTYKLSCTQISENGWCNHNKLSTACPVSCGVECLN